MKIIETSKKTYIAAEVTEVAGGMSQLDGAVVVGSYNDKEDLAFRYIRATMLGEVVSVKVRTQTLESIEEANEVSKIIKQMEANMPEAKRRAEVKAVLEELAEMLDMSYSNSDYDD
jgi:hypothetical protein